MSKEYQNGAVAYAGTREDQILEKLKDRVKRIGYGSLVCELQIHQGQISQIEVTAIREKMRIDIK